MSTSNKCPMQHFIAIGDSGRPRPVTRADFKDTIKDLKHGEFRTRLSYAGGVPLRTLAILERDL